MLPRSGSTFLEVDPDPAKIWSDPDPKHCYSHTILKLEDRNVDKSPGADEMPEGLVNITDMEARKQNFFIIGFSWVNQAFFLFLLGLRGSHRGPGTLCGP